MKLSIEPETNTSGSPLEPVTSWNGLLRAVKGDLPGGLGIWILTGRLEPVDGPTPGYIDPNAIDDILVVRNYSL